MTQIAPLVAFGLGVRIPAAGPAHLRLYSHSDACVPEPQQVCADVLCGHRRTSPPAAADRYRPRPHRPEFEPTWSASRDGSRSPAPAANPKASPMLNPRQHRPPPEKRPERIRWPSSSCRLAVISRAEYGVKNGRRRDSHTREAAGPSSRVRRCGHRTRRDSRGRLRLCVCYRVDSGTRRGARGTSCSGFDARLTRIAAQQPRGRATPAAAPLCAAGWNSDLSQLSPRARRAGRQPRPRGRRHGHVHRRFDRPGGPCGLSQRILPRERGPRRRCLSAAGAVGVPLCAYSRRTSGGRCQA